MPKKKATRKSAPVPRKPSAPKSAKKAAGKPTSKPATKKAAKKPVKKAAKKAVTKKTVKKAAAKPAKKAAVKKTVKKKVATKKAVKQPAKKVTAKKAPKAKPSSGKKSAKTSSTPPVRTGPRFPIIVSNPNFPVQSTAQKKKGKSKPRALTPVFLEKQKQKLIELRDHILDQMQGVAQDSLRSNGDSGGGSAFGMHQADAGSDAYEKDFALSLLSQEQDALYEVEEAIVRINSKTYGICEMSGDAIPKARLEAIPFARFTVECQHQVEKSQRGKSRWNSSPQFMKSTDNFFDESDNTDDDDRSSNKD